MDQTVLETILEARRLRRRLGRIREEFLKEQEHSRRQRETMERERDERRRADRAPTSHRYF
jgi:hypothetical protein